MPQLPDRESTGAWNTQGRLLLGRFRIEKVLGHGGMGEVFLAHDTLLGRRVALKRLRPDDGDRDAARRAILREARRASQINDRHIAAIHDVLEIDDDVVLVMEYVDGVTLRSRMAEPLSLEDFWGLALQCVGGVAAAHEHGVIHRDIKPENLMVTPDGQVRILDFGVARRSGAGEHGATSSEEKTHWVAGTPRYMAPEAHLGGETDARTDIFSLGVVFYELLTGRPPFEGTTYAAIANHILNSTPVPVVERNPAAGPKLSAIVARMLARAPEDRFASAAELRGPLEEARGETAGMATPLPRPEPSARDTRTTGTTVPLAGKARPVRAWILAGAAVAVAVVLWRLQAPSLPASRILAVLLSASADSSDFGSLAAGSADWLSIRLHAHVSTPGFQMVSFRDVLEQHVRTVADARQVLGANLALVVTLTRDAERFHQKLDLFETERGRRIASRSFDSPIDRPFDLLDRSYRESAGLVGLRPRPMDSATDLGIRGAGTLRFFLQGTGRLRATTTVDEANRAADEFETACRMEPDAAAARAGLASAWLTLNLRTGDRQWLTQATTAAREAVTLDPRRADAHRALGFILGTDKDYRGSLMEFARAVDLDPTDDQGFLLLARTYRRLGEREKERETYMDVSRRRPHCWQPYSWLGSWYFREGRLEESTHAYEEMLRCAPANSTGYASLGGVLVLRGEYGRAIEALKRSVAIRPNRDAYSNLGTAYFNTGRFVEAVDAYNQSFQFGTADYVLWFNLGDAYYWLRDRKEQAADAYAQAIRLGRDQMLTRERQGRTSMPEIPADLATLFARTGQPDSARYYLARAVAADTANPNVAYSAALTCWQLNEKPRAIEWLRTAVRNGYPVVWLKDSPIFHEWRELPEFRTMIGGTSPEPGPAASQNRGGGS